MTTDFSSLQDVFQCKGLVRAIYSECSTFKIYREPTKKNDYMHSYSHHKNKIKTSLIIIIIVSCRWHGYPWPSLATFPYRLSPLAGLQGYIPYPHIAAVCMFELVVLLLLGHMWGSISLINRLLSKSPPNIQPTIPKWRIWKHSNTLKS